MDNPIVENKINTTIKKDVYDFAKKNREKSKNIKDMFTGTSVTFEEYYVNEDMISIDMTFYYNNGTVSQSVLYDKGYNFQLSNGNNYTLSQIFKEDFNYVDFINKEIENQIKEAEKSSTYYKYNFKGINKDQPYFIYRGNLVILFSGGEILPIDFRNLRVYIPLYKFSDNINLLFISNNLIV